MAASMDVCTHHRTFRPYKISVVYCRTRNNTDQRTSGYNSSHHYNVLREMRGNRYTTASTNFLRGRISDMDLDKGQDSGNTTHKPHTYTRGMDPTPDLPSLPPPPKKKPAAIIWIVAHLVAYRLQTQRRLSLTDYMDFLQRARWKEYHRTPKTPTVGRYLDVL